MKTESNSIVHIAIVGRPNVGKSTLFNKLIGKRKSIVEENSGTTRDRLYERIQILDEKEVLLIDTGGIKYSLKEDLDTLVDKEVNKAVVEADLILFVTDINPLTSLDLDLANDIRQRNKKVLLVVNKADDAGQEGNVNEYYRLGFGAPLFISSIHGRGVSELCESMYNLLPASCVLPKEAFDFKLAIIGEPNAGKSTLLNGILGKQRSVVSDIPGTTRDSVEEVFVYNDMHIKLIDTAGIKKKNKITSAAGIFSLIRAQKSIRYADVTLLIIDATKGPRRDTRIIYKTIVDAQKGCVIIVNKWDLVKGLPMEDYKKRLIREYGFLKNTKILFISAKTGRNIDMALRSARTVWRHFNASITTHELHEFLNVVRGARVVPPQIKLKHMVQINVRPPSFLLFVKNKKNMLATHIQYIANALIDYFKLEGTKPEIYLREEER